MNNIFCNLDNIANTFFQFKSIIFYVLLVIYENRKIIHFLNVLKNINFVKEQIIAKIFKNHLYFER